MSEEARSMKHDDSKTIRMFKTEQEERDLAAFLRSAGVRHVSIDFSGRHGDFEIYAVLFTDENGKYVKGDIGQAVYGEPWIDDGMPRTITEFLEGRLEEAIEQTGIECRYDDGGCGDCIIRVRSVDALEVELRVGVRVVEVDYTAFSAGRVEATWTE